MNSRDQNNKSPLLLQLPKTYSDMSGNSFLIPVAVENVAEPESSQQNIPVTSTVTETAPFSQLEQPLFMCRRPSDPKMAVPYSETNTQSRNIESRQPVESHSGPIAAPLQSDLGVTNQFSETQSQPAYSAVGPPPLSSNEFSGYPNEPPTIYPESVGEFHNTTSMPAAYSSQPPVMPVTNISMNLRKDATQMPYVPLSNSNQSFNNQQLNETPTTEFYSRYYEPVKPYWLFLDIVESKEVWYGFSEIDSHNLEVAFQQNPQAIVPVDGGRYDAVLSDRIKKPVYFEAKDMQISRGTWFYRRSSSQRFIPFPEIASDVLEQNYANCVVSGQWLKRVDIPGIGSVIMESPQVLLYYRNEVEMWPTLPDSKTFPQPVKRCLPENFEIMASENNQIDHLVFIVQGIGSFCDLRFRTVSECVDGFRDISNKLLAVHFKQELQSGQVGRVEFLPLAWHAKLHTCEKGFDKHMQKITLPSIPKLRHFTNDTLLDILLYSSPTYCQSIIDTVASELNKLYEIFLRRNHYFSGKVFVAGHSLGSLILFDILSNQNPNEIQLNRNEINDQIKDTVYESSSSKNPQDLKPHTEGGDILEVISENNIHESFDSLPSLLEACQLEEYTDLFEKEKVDLSSVSLMSNEDLKDLGLPAGPRKKLLSAIHPSKQRSHDGSGDAPVLPSSSSSQSTISDSQNQTLEFESQNVSEDSESLKFPIRTSPCMSSIKYPKLHFEPACFFALGSPISMFLTVRGYAQICEDFRLPTCPGFFHIFHPYDPVAFRIEPLIEPTFSAKPVLIPHHKGRKRMHLEIRENLSKVGSEIKQKVMETLRYTWDSLSGFARAHSSLSAAVEAEVDKLMKQQQISESNYEIRAPSETSGEDIQIGSLNGGRRIDYVLQEKPIEALNDYIFALTSHATYWDSEDTVLMILREIYATQGILLSSQSLETKYLSANSFQDSCSKLNTAVSDPALYQSTQMDLQSIKVSSISNDNETFPSQSGRTQQPSINFMDPYHGMIPMSQANVPPPMSAPQFYSPNSASFSQPFEPPPVSAMQTVLPPSTCISQPTGTISESVSQSAGPPPPAPPSQPLGPPPLTGFVRRSPFTR